MLLLSRNTQYIIFDSDIYHNYRGEDNVLLFRPSIGLHRAPDILDACCPICRSHRISSQAFAPLNAGFFACGSAFSNIIPNFDMHYVWLIALSETSETGFLRCYRCHFFPVTHHAFCGVWIFCVRVLYDVVRHSPADAGLFSIYHPAPNSRNKTGAVAPVYHQDPAGWPSGANRSRG